MKKSVSMQLLLFGVLFFTVSDIEAQWGRPMWGDRYQRGMVYRSRPRVSVGIGAYGGFGLYPGYWGLSVGPGMGLSIGMNVPGVGIRLNALPPGYQRMDFGGVPYYYYDDGYYQRLDRGGYVSVAPPLGATVRRLPGGVRELNIDGETYYKRGGTYFREETAGDGAVVYRVVGVRGRLNTGSGRLGGYSGDDPVYNDNGRNYPSVNDQYTPSDNQQNRAATSDDYNTGPQVGDRFDQLPRNSRAISVDGAKQYVSPSGTYYKEIQEDGKTVYEVVRMR
jgi:hypothetical protein